MVRFTAMCVGKVSAAFSFIIRAVGHKHGSQSPVELVALRVEQIALETKSAE